MCGLHFLKENFNRVCAVFVLKNSFQFAPNSFATYDLETRQIVLHLLYRFLIMLTGKTKSCMESKVSKYSQIIFSDSLLNITDESYSIMIQVLFSAKIVVQ